MAESMEERVHNSGRGPDSNAAPPYLVSLVTTQTARNFFYPGK